MAIISKILALPSATQYNPTAPTITGNRYNPSSYGDTSVGNFFDWTEPSAEWKNKASASYRYTVERYDSVAATWSQVSDTFLNAFLAYSTTFKGIRHRARAYTRSNNTDLYNSYISDFYPQTKPYQSPTVITYSANSSSMSVSWDAITNSEYWGGAPDSSVNSDRQYLVLFEGMPGNILVGSITTPSTSATFGGSFSGDYRIVVYAQNKAGLSTFISGSSTGTFTISANNSNRCTSFDISLGECFSLNSCCPTSSFCSGSACVA